MKKKLFLFITFAVLGIVQAIIFLIMFARMFESFSFAQCLLSLIYAVPQSLMVSAWVMVPCFVVGLAYVFIRGEWHRRFMIRYTSIVLMAMLFLCCLDWIYFSRWGFRLDATPLIYFFSDPWATVISSPWWTLPLLLLLTALIGWLVTGIMGLVYPKRRSGSINRMSTGSAQQMDALKNLLMTVVMCIIGSGCFGLMGMGSSYFTDKLQLDYAAINPVYSFFYGVRHYRTPLDKQYRFMSDDERRMAIGELDSLAQLSVVTPDTLMSDSLSDALLKLNGRPNVAIVVLESFSGAACQYLNSEADGEVMPNVNRQMAEGLAFTRCYANSFRSERGLVSILSAYPGQPSYTVMNDVHRSSQLDYITLPFANAGYTLDYLCGRDLGFTHFPDYLRMAGIEHPLSRDAFDAEQHDASFGLHDAAMFDCLFAQLQADARAVYDTLAEYAAAPSLRIFSTASGLEPDEVPFRRFADSYLNRVAYTDSCLGAFIDKLKADTCIWNNLLLICLSDNASTQYPESAQPCDPNRYHIPMFWTGGVVNGHHDVTALCQQTDLAATLIHQLGMQPEGFRFSHDVLSSQVPHFAFYTWPDGFGFLTDSCRYIQDNNYDHHPLWGSDDPTGRAERLGKAYLQTLYDDLSQLQ